MAIFARVNPILAIPLRMRESGSVNPNITSRGGEAMPVSCSHVVVGAKL